MGEVFDGECFPWEPRTGEAGWRTLSRPGRWPPESRPVSCGLHATSKYVMALEGGAQPHVGGAPSQIAMLGSSFPFYNQWISSDDKWRSVQSLFVWSLLCLMCLQSLQHTRFLDQLWCPCFIDGITGGSRVTNVSWVIPVVQVSSLSCLALVYHSGPLAWFHFSTRTLWSFSEAQTCGAVQWETQHQTTASPVCQLRHLSGKSGK